MKWTKSGFDGFRKGTFGNGGQNLYVTASGTLQRIFNFDVNGDGYPDIPIANSHSMNERPEIYIYNELGQKEPLKLPTYGAFDAILTSVGLEGWIRSWLSDETVVNYVLAFVSLWKYSGYHIILFIAALQSVPQDIMEAAKVDGASSLQMFRYIQVPAIMLMVDYVLFDNIRGALQVFDIPFVMTAGGPGYASSTFTLYTIKTAFTFSNFGLASTMAIAIMVMIVIIYVVQNYIIHGLILKDRRNK